MGQVDGGDANAHRILTYLEGKVLRRSGYGHGGPLRTFRQRDELSDLQDHSQKAE